MGPRPPKSPVLVAMAVEVREGREQGGGGVLRKMAAAAGDRNGGRDEREWGASARGLHNG